MSKIVGRMSMVATQASSTLPCFWPGALISSGTGAISPAFPRVSRRRSRRLREGHAVVGRDHDQGRCPTCPPLEVLHSSWSSRSANPVWRKWRWSSTSSCHWSLYAWLESPGIASLAWRAVAAPVGQVLPGHVRQQRVLEVERRPAARPDRRRSTPRSAPRARRSGSRACWRSAPVLPRSGPSSDAPPKSPQFSETDVSSASMSGGETTCSHTSPRSSLIDLMPVAVRLVQALVLAQVARADRRGLLGDVHAVRLAEQREDAVRVVGGGGQLVLRRQVAVHDRGLGALGGVVDGVGVAEPGGAARQLGEAGIALRVDPAVLVDQRVRRAARRAARPRSAPALTPPIVRACASSGKATFETGSREQEQRQEHERRRRQHARNERTGSARAYSAATPRRSPPTARSARCPRR